MKKFKLTAQVPTESSEQMTVVAWARAFAPHCPELKLFYAIPNSAIVRGPRRYAVIMWMKNLGMANGVPDLVLPVRRDPYGGLYLEMKRREGGRLSSDQKWWVEQLRSQNYHVVVPRGAKEAIAAIENYLGISQP